MQPSKEYETDSDLLCYLANNITQDIVYLTQSDFYSIDPANIQNQPAYCTIWQNNNSNKIPFSKQYETNSDILCCLANRVMHNKLSG